MDALIPLFKTVVPPHAVRLAAERLESGWLSEGERVREFEDAFRARFGVPHALALNSGTSALHLAVLGAGLGPGDEVVTTAQTFVATAMAILQVGATPVFADLEPDSPNLDPADVEKRLTPRTKAILLVHYGGLPCDMERFYPLAVRHRLALIEDCAHALGAKLNGKPAGALGDFAAFSFQAIKPMTTGDGGLLACRHEADHVRARRRRWFGIDRLMRRPSETGQPEWDIEEIGFKYHMNDLNATLGLAQLEVFDEGLRRRRLLNRLYREELGRVPGVLLPAEPASCEPSPWLFTMLVQRRLEFVRAMKSRGVDAAAWHRRIDRHPVFGGIREDLPRLARFDEMQVSVPLRESLTDREVDAVLAAVRKGW